MNSRTDVLPQVLISPLVWAVWYAKAAPLVNGVARRCDLPSNIPDKRGEIMPDGRLRIHVTMPDGTVLAEMLVWPNGWRRRQS